MVSQKKKIFVDLFSLSMSSNIQRAISFFVFLLIMKELTVHDYGVLTLLFTIPGPFMSVIGFGIGDLITSEIAKARGAKNEKRVSQIFFEYYILKIAIFLILISSAYFLKEYLVVKYDIDMLKYFNLLIFYTASLLLVNFYSILLSGYEKFVQISIINLFEPIVRLFMLFVFLLNGGFDISTVLFVYAASKLFSFVMALAFINNILVKIAGIFSFQKFNTLFILMRKYGKWLTIRDFLNQIAKNINPWLIKVFLNTQMVGIYGVAQKITGIISAFMPISKISFPLVAKNINNPEKLNIIIPKLRKYSLLLSSVIVIFIFSFVDIAMMSFFPKYFDAILLIKILSLRIIIASLFIGQKGLLFGYNMQKFQLVFFMYSFCQNMVINVFLLYHYSLIGLAIAGIIHSLFTYIVSDIYLMKKIKHYKFKFIDYLKYDEYDRMIIRLIFNKIRNNKFLV